MKYLKPAAAVIAAMMLTACGNSTGESTVEMEYIKSSTLYDTLQYMYQYPDDYLGKNYHMVGTLYPSTDEDGETFYSVYASAPDGGEGIGLELDWSNDGSLKDYDKITVEGKLEKASGTHDGNQIEYLILRVSMLEKRDS